MRARSRTTGRVWVAMIVDSLLAAGIPGSAAADQDQQEDSSRDHLVTPDGLSIVVGAGVADFIDEGTRSATDTAETWEARVAYGTRSHFGVEAAYVGSWQEIDALGLDDHAVLLGSAGETSVRFNALNVPYVQPYAFAGAGMTWFTVVNDSFNNSSVDDSETAVYFPLGIGLVFAAKGFVFDVRGVYRPMEDDDLVENSDDNGGNFGLDSWSATAHAGVEF